MRNQAAGVHVFGWLGSRTCMSWETHSRAEREKKADVSIFVPEVQCGGWHKHKSCEGRAMKLFLTLESSRLEGS